MNKIMKNLSIVFLLSVLSVSLYANNKLIIVGESYPPYQFSKEGKITGIDVDVADHIFTKLGVEYKISICPWKRCWSMLVDGKADVGLVVSNQQKRSEYIFFPENAVWKADFVAFALNSTKKNNSINSLYDIRDKRLKVGIVNGNSYYPDFWKVFRSPEKETGKYHPLLEPGTTAEQNFKKLAAGRIDLFIIPETVGLYILKSLGLSSEITNFNKVFFSKPYYNAFSRNSSFSNRKYSDITQLIRAYDLELEEFKKTDEFKAITIKYLGN